MKSILLKPPANDYDEIVEVAHVVFPVDHPTMRHFKDLLKAIYTIAPKYNLIKVCVTRS